MFFSWKTDEQRDMCICIYMYVCYILDIYIYIFEYKLNGTLFFTWMCNTIFGIWFRVSIRGSKYEECLHLTSHAVMYNACVQPCIDRALQRMLQTQPGTTLYEAPADVHWGCFVKLPVTIWPEFCQLCIYRYLYPKSFPTCSMRLEYLPSHLAFFIYGVPSMAG